MRADSVIRIEACAKINLTFEVLGKRPDGYHEIVSVIQAISLCDTLTLEPSGQTSLSCNIPELVTPHNLVLRALRLMQQHNGRKRRVAINIDKSIPPASGLGGGSSDAAATLIGLNQLWKAGISRDNLVAMAADIGSDVPFFASGASTALVRGRGELVQPLPSPPETWVVLLCPPIGVPGKTAAMYSRLPPSMHSRGEHSEKLVERLASQSYLGDICYNTFEGVAPSFFSGLDNYRRRFLSVGAPGVYLSGAGPTLFSIIASHAQAMEIVGLLRKEKLPAYLARTL